MGKDFLNEVILEKQRTLKEGKRRYPQEELRLKLEEPRDFRSFKKAIDQKGKLSIIGEIKKASPSEGILRDDFDHIQIARIYQNSGIAAVSILTEEKYFLGKLTYLGQIRKIVTLPILRKDFIFDMYQLYESKFFGADCVLLITEILKNGKLSEFLALGRRLELDCLVEVNSEDDIKYALDQGSEIIGINNRNLHTLEIDKKNGIDLIKHVGTDRLVVMESAISTRNEYLKYNKLKVNALLIGSSFMKADDLKKKIKDITEGSVKMQKKAKLKKQPRKVIATKSLKKRLHHKKKS